MTWSTRELADLAGTTVNTVRHYHAVGLLDAPDRRYNGYKQYRVRHLVRLLQVRRLAELGVPLAQVETDAEGGVALQGELHELDERVEAEIERLRRARSDIAALLRDRAPVDTPRGFESIASRLSAPDLALIHIYSSRYDVDSLARLKAMVAAEPIAVSMQFNGLSPDADERLRSRVAARLEEAGSNWRSVTRPWLAEPVRRRGTGAIHTSEAVAEMLRELYSPAQIDVLNRAEDAWSEKHLENASEAPHRRLAFA